MMWLIIVFLFQFLPIRYNKKLLIVFALFQVLFHKNVFFFYVVLHKELCKYGLHVGILKQILGLVVRSPQHVRQRHLQRWQHLRSICRRHHHEVPTISTSRIVVSSILSPENEMNSSIDCGFCLLVLWCFARGACVRWFSSHWAC